MAERDELERTINDLLEDAEPLVKRILAQLLDEEDRKLYQKRPQLKDVVVALVRKEVSQ